MSIIAVALAALDYADDENDDEDDGKEIYIFRLS